jgi:hypothetical protein
MMVVVWELRPALRYKLLCQTPAQQAIRFDQG